MYKKLNRACPNKDMKRTGLKKRAKKELRQLEEMA